ncbi:MAG: RtcB family protein [Dehalococcoidia bacterium]|nr:RtcB family protein [Dehalococcoidia bacterium]
MYQINETAISWVPPEQIESIAMQQIVKLASMPFIFKHVAVMPDCHVGMGATVGSCIPTDGAIIPAAVGVDIGCGMVAVRTPLSRSDLPADLSGIREGIERRIPLSAGKYDRRLSSTAKVRVTTLEEKAGDRLSPYRKLSGRADWRLQLGSLGSGNHFIEITVDESGSVWAFLHSGSRGIGNKIAMQHIRTAQRLMKRQSVRLPDRDLAYLTEGTEEFDDYIRDLRWAQDFALLNREEMMDRVMTELSYTLYGEGGHEGELELERIQCHHNFTQKERHYGKDVWVSRKGAIQAKEGQMGLIPGSMGTASYVVRGLGSEAAFETAPHGAGRRFSRSQARKRFTMDDFDRDMQGIEVRRSKEFIDELPGAYKDIDMVMEQSKDLVEIVHTFRQIVNVKGD